jgi:hypothetical protein
MIFLLPYKILGFVKEMCIWMSLQCWTASVFLFEWAKATTWKFRIQVLFALLMTFATDANKAIYEKSLEEGVTVYQILCAGLEAM